MKLRSVRYLTGEGIKNMWTNRLMTIASVGVLVACMVLIGLAMLISLNVNKAVGQLEQQNVIMAYFNDRNSVIYGDSADKQTSSNSSNSTSSKTSNEQNTSSNNNSSSEDKNEIPYDSYLIHNEEEAKALCEEILKALENNNFNATVVYVSSDDGLQSIKDSLLEGKDEYFTFLDEDGGNPLSSAAKITIDDMSRFSEAVNIIKAIKGVDSIQSQSDLADTINVIKNGIGIAGFWIIAILMVISLVIVSNTVRMTMFTRKLEIGIMKAVGATNSFIRLPFVIEGMAIGVISSFFALGILYFCYRVVSDTIADTLGLIELVSFSSVLFELLAVFIIIGLISGLIGSLIMISKYLRKEGSEFTAI